MRASLGAASTLGMRAVFVLDEERRERWQAHASNRFMICSYAPYSTLFPRAAVVIHHGGVGTTAQALRSGRPQLIAPYLVDQPDNAARVQRLGCGIALPLGKYRTQRVAAELQHLLADKSFGLRALEVAKIVAAEDGAETAVRIISARLGRLRTPARVITES
jgi:rhamnosyltransferase subunit B